MKKINIPTCMNPFEVSVNGVKHSYPAGTEQEVPMGVAMVIEQHGAYHEEKERIAKEGDGSQGGGTGGGGYSTCKVHVSIEPDTYGYEFTYSTLDDNGKPTIKNIRHWFDSSEYEYDIEVICGSFIAIGDENMNGLSVQSEFAMTQTGASYTYCLFVPIGATSSSISVSMGY